MQIHQTKYQTIVHEPENAMLIITWQYTQTMSDEKYREELQSQLVCIQTLNPLRMLIDTSHFDFQIFKLGRQKISFLKPLMLV